MSKHTPGPWHAGRGQQSTIVYDAEGWGVASATVFHGRTEPETSIANASLIAAAPDLLAALELVLDDPQSLDGRPRTYEAARAAIAKAKGLPQ